MENYSVNVIKAITVTSGEFSWDKETKTYRTASGAAVRISNDIATRLAGDRHAIQWTTLHRAMPINSPDPHPYWKHHDKLQQRAYRRVLPICKRIFE